MEAKQKLQAKCPYCSSVVALHNNVRRWDIVTCSQCMTELQVVALNPPELDYTDEDDWDDEDGQWDYEDAEFDEVERRSTEGYGWADDFDDDY